MTTTIKPTARFDGTRNFSPAEMAVQREVRLDQLLAMLRVRRMSVP